MKITPPPTAYRRFPARRVVGPRGDCIADPGDDIREAVPVPRRREVRVRELLQLRQRPGGQLLARRRKAAGEQQGDRGRLKGGVLGRHGGMAGGQRLQGSTALGSSRSPK